MPKTLAFLLLSLFLLCFSSSTAAGDADALLRVKASVSGDPAGLLSSWAGSDPCSWLGVSCDAASRVVGISISASGSFDPSSCLRAGPTGRRCPDASRRLAGILSAAVAELGELRTLSLTFHAFSGEIPAEIWRLENLEVVDLEGNSISGGLPGRFPPRLRVLNLAFNLLEGEIPPSLSNSRSLETLDLSGNRINGSVPKFLFQLPNLRALSLAFNRLGGSIADGFTFNCWNLEHLDLSGNSIIGNIPQSLGNCSKLQYLLLFSNLIDGAIPPELGLLKKLRVLDVSRNCLSGSLPSELAGCGELSVLVLSNPYFPVVVQNDSSYVASDDFNYFQGGLPEKITSLPKLRVLWAPRGLLGGVFPSDWGACETLEMVHLGHDLLIGEVTKAFWGCRNLKFLNLSSNNLAGSIGAELPVPCMDMLDVGGNRLSGSIPIFKANSCPSSYLSIDDLASSYYSYFAHMSRSAISLPSIGFEINSVVYHNFGHNNFNGSLPPLPLPVDSSRKKTIYVFLADRNKLVGPLTDIWFDKCGSLSGFVTNLTENMIFGEIPKNIGATCSILMAFEIAGNQILGKIPPSLGQLDNVVVLDLSRNHLQGQIPESFGNMKQLNYLSLARNNLTGAIPPGLVQLHSLKVLDLSSNSFYGEIPSGFVDLMNLTVLLLENNKLSGKIPVGFASVASFFMFNLSHNNLSGPLPRNGSRMRCDSVLENPLLEPCPLVHSYSLSIPPADLQGRSGNSQSYSYTPPPAAASGSNGFSSIEIASITSAAAIVSVLFALIVLYVYTRKCAANSPVQPSGRREVKTFTDIGVPLTYESVVRATGNFNASNCIGSGGFGATYKAEISPGVLVAIKRLSVGRFQGVQQFQAEIKTLGRWRHPNLVTLIGYHVSEAEMFLIYNYLPGGNLERFIQERSKRPVDWRMLHKIALDVARALAYLHDHCVPRILHRDVKPSNILLDNEFNAYLSDFGLARLLGNSETHVTTGVAGTFGYVAPEYAMTCRVSDKADVYSYGVVLLELISDKKALDPSFSPYGNGFNIVAWACMLFRQGRAHEFFAEGLWDVGPHDNLVETLHLAVRCTVETLSVRPTMKQVVQRLKQLQPPS